MVMVADLGLLADLIRDSQHPAMVLALTPAAWRDLTARIRSGHDG